MAVWRFILAMWRRRQRKIDLDILWPLCVKGAFDLEHAKAAFATHCFNDPAWLELGEDAIFQFVDRLEP